MGSKWEMGGTRVMREEIPSCNETLLEYRERDGERERGRERERESGPLVVCCLVDGFMVGWLNGREKGGWEDSMISGRRLAMNPPSLFLGCEVTMSGSHGQVSLGRGGSFPSLSTSTAYCSVLLHYFPPRTNRAANVRPPSSFRAPTQYLEIAANNIPSPVAAPPPSKSVLPHTHVSVYTRLHQLLEL